MMAAGEREIMAAGTLLERWTTGAGTDGQETDGELQPGSRLRVVGSAFAAVWVLTLVLFNLVAPALGGVPAGRRLLWPMPGNGIALTGLVASLGLAYMVRRQRAEQLPLLGATFVVLTCFLLGLLSFWGVRLDGIAPAWIGLVILGYAGIVPGSPALTLGTTLLAATMAPLAAGVAAAAGAAPQATRFEFLMAFLPNYVCAMLAVTQSRLVRRLRQRAQEARDLGSYRLERVLSRGGMGEVYRASHRTLARPAAIKLIRPERLGGGDSPTARVMRTRFQREAEAVASLRSPHTVSLYDYGVARDGRHFLVMELLDGMDLDTLVRRHGPVAPARAVHLLRQACESLAEAHARGMIHRDIKPSNIFACRLGLAVDFVKVLDFGLVREPEREDVRLTAPDRTAGTPAYMAPESIIPRQPVDHRVDIYALGCVAYWLVTGEPVFRGESTVDLLLQHAHSLPPRPSERGARIPMSLEALIMACLAKAPAARPQTAADLAQQLGACLSERDGWDDSEAQAWWDRHHPAPRTAVSAGRLSTDGPRSGNISETSPTQPTEIVTVSGVSGAGATSAKE